MGHRSKRKKLEIEFIDGFQKRTTQDVIDALNEKTFYFDMLGRSIYLDVQGINLPKKLINRFELVPNPVRDNDWLAQYNEPGQSCNQLLWKQPIIPKKSLGITKFIYFV